MISPTALMVYLASPSMRREWIEMYITYNSLCNLRSPSMRREWIEIQQPTEKEEAVVVSLHAEGVD